MHYLSYRPKEKEEGKEMNPLIATLLTVMVSGFVFTSPINSTTYLGKAPEEKKEKDSSDEQKEPEVIESQSIKLNKQTETKQNYIEENKNAKVKSEKETSKKKSLGTFKLTAYCSCEKCCGSYAKNRPVDENGKQIVYGSSGEVLKEGISIAVDTKVIPFGSKVVIDNNEYIAHDTGGAIKSNKIDVYFEDHQRALDFGVQHKEVFVYE